MKTKAIISLIGSRVFSFASDWRSPKPSYCRAGNRVSGTINSSRDRIDKPIVASGIIVCYGVARNLDVGGFGRRRLHPIGRHVDPKIVTIRVEEMDEHGALKGL